MAKQLKDWRAMDIASLIEEVTKLRDQLTTIKLNIDLGKEKDTAKRKRLRRHLAQVNTILSHKQQELALSA
jgi:ribosomal protein L29